MTVETQAVGQQPKSQRARHVALFVAGLVAMAGGCACAYAAARIGLSVFQDRARDLGFHATVKSFYPLLHGIVFENAIIEHVGTHSVFVECDSAETTGWTSPDRMVLHNGSFHAYGPWYAVHTGTIERAEFRDEKGTLRFHIELSAPELVLDSPALYRYPVMLYDLHLTVSGYRDPNQVNFVIEEGLLRVRQVAIDFKYARSTEPEPLRQDLAVRIDNVSGAQLLASFPPIAIARLGKPAIEGDLSLAVTAHTDEEKPDTTRGRVEIRNACTVKNLSELFDTARLRASFKWEIMDESGGSISRESGPEPEFAAGRAKGGAIVLATPDDLEKWIAHTAETKAAWSVSDGVLACNGKGNGVLISPEPLANYSLTYEWRWTDRPGDSGLFTGIEVLGADSLRAIEVQMLAGAAGDFWRIGYYTGEDGALIIPNHVPRIADVEETPDKGWNLMEITLQNGRLDVHVNGRKVNELEGLPSTPTHFGLQLEGTAFEVRRLRADPLP